MHAPGVGLPGPQKPWLGSGDTLHYARPNQGTVSQPRLFGKDRRHSLSFCHAIASPVMRRGGGSLPESPLAQRALHSGKPLTQHMGIDLRGSHIRMPQQRLHGTNVATTPEQLGGKGGISGGR
jgi:hypothetical protein